MKYNNDENNVYAKIKTGEEKHISEVESGKKRYYCIGCGREMIAKKGDILKHHFAHDATDVQGIEKCTYSDESYRHKLGKEILQRIKQIKVPALYKDPPIGQIGKRLKIKDATVIYAHEVKIELEFYEDENGDVKHGRRIENDNNSKKYLLFKPDVTFFDSAGNPILLIELVATHKVDAEKLAKIRRLGIDLVEVSIPKDSPAAIEKTFYNTSKTEWLYNYERENTSYFSISETNGEGILSITEFEKRVFEAGESYKCRASQLRNLVRGFTKALESEQYRSIRQSIGGELQRVEENKVRAIEQLRAIQEQCEREAKIEFREETEQLERENNKLREEEDTLEQQYKGLETRYYNKKRELEIEEGSYRPTIESEIETIEKHLRKLGGSGDTFDERIAKVRRDASRIEESIRSGTARIERDKRDIRDKLFKIETRREKLQTEFRENESRIRAEFEERRRGIRARFEAIRDRTAKEYANIDLETIRAIDKRDYSGASVRIDNGIKRILDLGTALTYIREETPNLRRLFQIKEILNKGTYKNWI